jgi:spore coat polysaccharide biosynthesis protein SpsF
MGSAVIAVVQARMASSRLPGKVLRDIEGTAMLGRVVERTRLAATVAQVVLATTTDPADDAIEAYCRQHAVALFRGSHFDVLDRYYSAARAAGADVVVRITADCPLMDPGLIDATVRTLEDRGGDGFEFAATRLPPPWKRTFPIGLDVEACKMGALERAWNEAREPEEREHVMPYLYKGVKLQATSARLSQGISSSGVRIAVLGCPEDLGTQRWTVDTEEDLEFVRAVYHELTGRQGFTWQDVGDLLRSRPDLLQINAGVRHKTVGEVDGRAVDGGAE